MKKTQILGLAIVAMLVFGVARTNSASAATLQWLASGKAITTALASETVGEMVFGVTDGADLGVTAEILCSVIFIGTVGPGPEGNITEILNLSKEAVTVSKPIVCTNLSGCETGKWAPANLPWLTRLELMGTEVSPEPLLVLEPGGKSNPGWEIECTFPLIGKASETCTSPSTGAVFTNDATENDVLGVFKKEVIASCTDGGANTGFMENGSGDAELLTFLSNGLAAAASYE